MTSPLLRVLERALAAPDGPGRGAHVLVAASGGPDSTALLAGLAALASGHDLRLTAGHVDHGLRGAESAGDRAAVEGLAATLGVACLVAHTPVLPGANLEARAREIRRRALADLARRSGAALVALGHTRDDQVETVLLRLLRGTGRGGLGGMWPRRGRIWRPLLAATRADVRRYLGERQLPFRVDHTNADLRHARNRLRRLVVPLLAREFNPRLGDAVAGLATRLRDEDALLDGLATARLAVHAGPDWLATSVVTEPAAIARRVAHAWLSGVRGTTASADDVERILALAAPGARGTIGGRGPDRIVREGQRLVHRAEREAPRPPFRHEVIGPCVVRGPEGAWELTVSGPRPRAAGDLSGLGARLARFDADVLAWPLVVRSRERGDRIAVPGVGTRTIQDVLVDAKVPRERRSAMPLVADAAGTIVWVPDIVRGGGARVTDATRRVVEIAMAPCERRTRTSDRGQ